MSQINYIPSEDGDRPILAQRFPTTPSVSSVAIQIINKATDATVATTAGTASQSTVDSALWLYDTADITGVNLETVGFAQLDIRFRATLSTGGNIDRSQDLVVGGGRKNLDAQISTRSIPGDAMDLVTDSIDSAAVATSGANEIRDSILADSTPFNGASIGAILADTTAIDTRLPTDPADESNQIAEHNATQSAIAALNDVSANQVRDAILADSTAFNGADIAAILADTLAIDTRLPSDPADESNQLAQHTATQSAISALNNITANQVRDAILSDSTPFAGASIAAILADTLAIDTRLPTDPADESNQLAQHTATQAAISALNDVSATAVRDAILADSTPFNGADVGSILTATQVIAGLVHDNGVLDTTVYDGDGNMTSARLRTYNSKANAQAAGGTGLIDTFTVTATYSGGRLATYTLVREGS
jgi:hypothetical protein